MAMDERGEKLRIFDVNHKKAATLAQITLKLTEAKEIPKNALNAVDWISDGMKAQNNQFV